MNEELAKNVFDMLMSADGRLGRKRGWGGREHGAEASLGRKRAWGGSEPGAEGRLPSAVPVGRKGAWGGREPRAEGSLGWKGGWGGREPRAEGSMGRRKSPACHARAGYGRRKKLGGGHGAKRATYYV